MKNHFLRSIICALIALSLLTVGCTSTSNQNGVQIQKQRSLNPFDYIPFL